ncbi:MAG: FAD-dependent oxidoreductase [Myxococcota bacterium]
MKCLVVGGGVHGLSTAWWLAREGHDVTLLERHAPGHDRGSSHGQSRITRTAYGDPLFVKLMQRCHAEAWPALEADVGRRLLHPRDLVFFGPAGAMRAHVEAAGEGVEVIDPGEARRRFPDFRFAGEPTVLHDHTAAIVAAADTIASLARWLGDRVRAGVEVLAVDARGADTSRGRFEADRVVVCAGAWAPRLVPRLGRLAPIAQTVGYFDVDAPDLPLWAYNGEQFFYGLPAFGRPGIKAALHVTAGRVDDPDVADGPGVAAVRAFLGEQLARPLGATIATERCLYTCTDDEDFVLDEVDGVVVGAGFTGHGFKFGPLVGRILGELATRGRTTIPEFEEARWRFSA